MAYDIKSSNSIFRKLSSLAFPFFVAATASCGGGSGSGGSGGQDNTLTGRFVDGPVSGLRYSTASQSGMTSANGEFLYQSGETVSFYVGDILIGQAPAAGTLTPFDLAGMAPPQSAVDIRKTINRLISSDQVEPLEKAANIAVFLQTIDSDGELSNGIQVPSQLHTLAAGVSIDFKRETSEFRGDFSFRKLLAAGRGPGFGEGRAQFAILPMP